MAPPFGSEAPHRTRLERDVELAFRQTLGTDGPAGLPDGEHLCVSRWIVRAEGSIAGTGKDAPAPRDTSPDRNLPTLAGGARLGKGARHGIAACFADHFAPPDRARSLLSADDGR
jgi:hypothetical protein